MNDQIELIRASVRPFITRWLVILWSLLTVFIIVWQAVTGINVSLNWGYLTLTTLTVGCTVWYYGERTYFKGWKWSSFKSTP